MAGLAIRTDGSYVDATFGRGGHSRAILSRLGEPGRLLGLDRDPDAVEVGLRLHAADHRFTMKHAVFSRLEVCWREYAGESQAQGVLMDLGVSSPQLDVAERGFGFMRDGPLDMRMDPSTGISASELVNRADEKELAEIFWSLGEEKHARRIARCIVKERAVLPITRTLQLADLIASVAGWHESGKHPATRCFQAIRIYVNRELEELREALTQAVEVLSPGGRLAVISFHSLEDRIVKRFMREQARGEQAPRNLPVRDLPVKGRTLRLVGKAIHPSAEEIAGNPRARSAVLRVAERLS